MLPIVENVLNEVRSTWRFRWLAAIVAWVLCLVGWAAVLVMPDTYEASARVFVDTRTTLSQVTQGITIESNVDQQIQRVRQALLGGPLLEKVANDSGLDARAKSPRERQHQIADLRDKVKITGSLGNDATTAVGLYVISYQAADRDLSLRVVDLLLKHFVQGASGGAREGSEQAQRFLQEQIADYEKRLSAAEARLADFKKEHVGLMPGAQGDYFTRLQSEMDAVSKAEASLRIAQTRRDAIQHQLSGQTPFTSAGASNTGAPALADDTTMRMRETQAKLDDLLLRFTEKHPDVIALRQTLVDLEKRRQAEIDAVRRGDPGAAATAGLNANPVFQSIQLQLNQSDVEIAALRGEISDGQKKIAEFRQMMNTAPEVEAELARLNRDYDVTRAQYQALVERLDRTKFSEEADATGIVRFEVIDPPTAPFTPVAPKRPLLIAGIMAISVAAGAAIAYLMNLLNPVFTAPRQLMEITGLPVLGQVSMTWIEKHHARERSAAVVYAGVLALLVVACAVVLLTQSRAVSLLHRFVA